MPGVLRVIVMVLVTLLVLTLLAGGTGKREFKIAAMLVGFFATIPVVIVVSAVHSCEVGTGSTGRSLIALIGGATAAFFLVVAPAMGVKGGLNGYSITGCLAGLLWSAAWILRG